MERSYLWHSRSASWRLLVEQLFQCVCLCAGATEMRGRALEPLELLELQALRTA